MAYKIYLDKSEEFICEVSVKNANLKNAFARMIVQSDELSLMFEGHLKDGKCIIPIGRMKGLLEENTKGKMNLEVIVEDTYFKPWTDDFVVEQHTAVKVRVEEQKSPSKPIVEVKTISKSKLPKLSIPASDITFICERVGITKSNLLKRSKDFREIVKEYFRSSPEFIGRSKHYVREVVSSLK